MDTARAATGVPDGHHALATGDWQGARAAFAEALDSNGDDAEALVSAAVAAADGGPAAELTFPEGRLGPRVLTRVPRAATLSADELRFVGQMVADRLAGEGRKVRAAVERGVGSVRAANSTGLDGGYETSLVSIRVDLALPLEDDHDKWRVHITLGPDL